MPCPTILEFANIANASYYAREPSLANHRRVHYGQLRSGFKGSFYELANVSSPYIVIAFAGTDDDTTEQTDEGDVLADSGFAGPRVIAATTVLNRGAAMALRAGLHRLNQQVQGALELTRQALNDAGPNRPVYVTGHSLGGGLAQIVCSRMQLQGVAFNAPATSQLNIPEIPRSRFLNVNEDSDPVSRAAGLIGNHQGRTRTVNAGVSGLKESHQIVSLIRYMQSGRGSGLASQTPF
ncbi:MAG: hypothetical protein AAF941_08405 [Pseudomonadota bacterium]